MSSETPRHLAAHVAENSPAMHAASPEINDGLYTF
jgi:hypothetical protein